jgi:hypothetical protein
MFLVNMNLVNFPTLFLSSNEPAIRYFPTVLHRNFYTALLTRQRIYFPKLCAIFFFPNALKINTLCSRENISQAQRLAPYERYEAAGLES